MAMPARRRSTKAPAPSPMTETHKGYIRRVLFTNAENGYTVFKFFSTDDRQEFTAVGHILNPRTDDEYLLRGGFTENPKFGRQFVVAEHQLLLPSTTKGVVSYLCAFGTGIGPAKAQRIVNALGEGCLERIKADPKLLQTVPGITAEQAGEVAKHLLGNVVLAELTALICREGVTANLATKIYSKYGAESVHVVKENPYVLADDIYGVGFVIADRVAGAVGLQANNPYRVEAAVMYVLREAANGDGHCYLRPSQIVKEIYSLLTKHCGIEVEDIGAAVVRLHGQGRVIREGPKGEFVYTKEMHGAEMGVAAALRRLMAVPVNVDSERVMDLLQEAQGKAKLEYSPEQVAAVTMALTSRVSILTGGPGTGKSEITKLLVDMWKRLHEGEGMHVYLAAPTGRAAKRLSEATGHEAMTIHRLLVYYPGRGFQINADYPLIGPGLLLTDESSMIDVELANSLLAAIPNNIQVVFIGDVDQLPSVGPGAVLRDIIRSGVIPTTRLTFNYRQAEGSKIAEYAHLILQGVVPPLHDDEDWNVRLIDEADQVADVVLSEVAKALNMGRGVMDVQTLCPQKRGSAGVEALNKALRELLNPNTDDESDYMGRFRENDKILVTKNDHDRAVYNGDQGFITVVIRKAEKGDDYGPGVVVEIDGREVRFSPDALLDRLLLAYATTIHKAQGSEYPLTIIVLTRQAYTLLERHSFYTAVTRARNLVVVVGQESAIRQAVKNNQVDTRNSRLAELLKGGRQLIAFSSPLGTVRG